AQAPAVVVVPLLVEVGAVRPVPLRRLEVLRPQEHPLVPMDRACVHGTVLSSQSRERSAFRPGALSALRLTELGSPRARGKSLARQPLAHREKKKALAGGSLGGWWR